MKNPDEVELKNMSKMFEYEAMSREIEGCDDIKQIKLIAKCYVKLYLSTLEAISDLKISY